MTRAHASFQDHIYKLMKSDSYARFLRSNVYQDLLMARKKVRLGWCRAAGCRPLQFLHTFIRFNAVTTRASERLNEPSS